MKRDLPFDVIGAYACHVCGRHFPLIWENHYVARDPGRTGLSVLAGGEEQGLHDAFDCPHCGCQNVMGDRLRAVNELICEESETEEADENKEEI
jgi:hypothetical protein